MKRIKIALPILAFVFATGSAFTTIRASQNFLSKDGGAPGSCVSGTLDQTSCSTTDHSEGRCTINGGAKNAYNTSNLTCQNALFINN